MSDKLLQALVRLFALITDADEFRDPLLCKGRDIVERFLEQQVKKDHVQHYMGMFDKDLELRRSRSDSEQVVRKRTSVNSVKVLRICLQINTELTQKQKMIVLIRLMEFVKSGAAITDQEAEFVQTVGETFNIETEDHKRCREFIYNEGLELLDRDDMLYITGQERIFKNARCMHYPDLKGEVTMMRVPKANMLLMRFEGSAELFLNGSSIHTDQNYLLTNGTTLRSQATGPIYYSDLISMFLSEDDEDQIVFKANNISYKFKNGGIGLHEMTFAERSGTLAGIMGGSGSGKSTLLNVLNGNLTPTAGSVTINGIDIHSRSEDINGLIGYVSQEDLLIEELSVFHNLYYAAKFCFKEMSKSEIAAKVLKTLNALGLYDVRDLKVGTVLDKTISGGQRKRLNIALELIREPSVLFVDEPTSGLSSLDSENIMDLLKELTLKGKLIFVVIHQPSSDIFKMFDKLLILDQEGHSVYNGDPVDSLIYFKRLVDHVNCDESECVTCGNVNPEMLFNIIEAKVVDEYGNLTGQRRISPQAWHEVYKEQIEIGQRNMKDPDSVPKSSFSAQGKVQQFLNYFMRDLHRKVTNTQYVLINFLEAPALALVLAFFLKFFKDTVDGPIYIFRENENLPQFLFISVIVALFLGLTVSAEEMIRDRGMIRREKFMELSRTSYLYSKISIMFIISAIQTFLFVLIGIHVLEIQGMGFTYWLILFSTACFANLLGLNVSATFNSAKVIYILIPVLIIPQLLFSGVIVKFDKLHPAFSSEKSVPWIGNIMASRWAYEALAVSQFMENDFDKLFYDQTKRMKYANWKKDFWVKTLKNEVAGVERILKGDQNINIEAKMELIRNEIRKESALISGIDLPSQDMLYANTVNETTLSDLGKDLNVLMTHYRRVYKDAEREKEKIISKMTETPEMRTAYFALMDANKNESLEDHVTNKNDLNVIVEYKGELIQKSDPIYLNPYESNILTAHFYAPTKSTFGSRISTKWANVLVLWIMSLILAITLYFETFKRSMERISELSSKLLKKKADMDAGF